MRLRFFWTQVWELTLASLKSRYRKTLAGFVWVILNPLLQFGVQSLVFKKFLNLNVPNYYLFLLGGLLPWIFIISTLQMSTPVFVSHSQLLKSFKINPFVVLGAQILDNFINFLASFILILLPFFFFSSQALLPLILLPVSFIPLLIGISSISMTLAIVNVFFRDTNFVIGFFLALLFFITPIFYPVDFVPENWRFLISFNPIYYLIEPVKILIYDAKINHYFDSVFKSFGVSLFFLCLSIFMWRKKKNDFYNRL
jgi:ABC-type polysaccharide/polyol phosphate export permease